MKISPYVYPAILSEVMILSNPVFIDLNLIKKYIEDNFSKSTIKTRKTESFLERHCIYYILFQYRDSIKNLTLSKIGWFCCDTDHSIVISSVKSVNNFLKRKTDYENKLIVFENVKRQLVPYVNSLLLERNKYKNHVGEVN